jgi:two-component system, sensor histidine kinase and response regulator
MSKKKPINKPTYKELLEKLTRSERKIKKLGTNLKHMQYEIERSDARRDILVRLSQKRTRSIQELLDFTLNEAISLTGSKIGYIYHYNESDKKFTLNSWSMDVMKECSIIEKQTVYRLNKTGIWGEAVRQARPVIVNDFQAPHPLKKGYPEGHAPLNNFMTIPVFIDGRIVGVVGVANKKTDYDRYDVMQLTLLMDSAWKLIERIRSKEALEISETRYRRLFETAQDGILIIDALTEQITDVNPFLIEMLGYTRKYFLGKKLWEIGAIKDRDASKAAFSKIQKTGYVRYEDLPLETKDSRLINVEFVSNSYLVDHHKVIQCNIRDITARKQAEDKLFKTKKNLEEQVRGRTAQLRAMTLELTQVEQRERKKIAEVIHDNLQQLLVGAKWGIQAVEKKEADDILRQSLERAAELVIESITVSRSLIAELSPPILHNEGLVAALKWLGRWMEEIHGIGVEIKTETEIEPESGGITYLLFQSVRELLLNVIKHSQVKLARVFISRKDDQIQIRVSDEGVGFDFSQLIKQGSEYGFGLLNIRERLGHIGGHMAIESAHDIGTRVTISAPLPKPGMQDGNDRIEPELSVLAYKKNSAGLDEKNLKIRVLVADDHRIMREGLCGLLRSLPDIEVVGEAFDGNNAVELTRQLRPNIVIMDVNMPGMNGIMATRHITSEMPDIKVIGLSMHEEADRASAMLKAGAVDYIHKAGPSEDLIASIREHSHLF